MITYYTAKFDPTVVTINVNVENSRYRDSFQSINMNNNDTFESGNKMELLFTRVTLLLKVLARNNIRNAMWKTLQYFLFQSQHIDRHVALLPWYFSKKNSFTVPIERPNDVSKYFQALQTYSPCLNPKKHTK